MSIYHLIYATSGVESASATVGPPLGDSDVNPFPPNVIVFRFYGLPLII